MKTIHLDNLAKVQWGWVLGASFVTLSLISATIFLATAIFASSRAVMGEIPNQVQVEQFTEAFGRWAGPISNLIFTFAVTTWLALRLQAIPRLHGFLVGLLVSVVGIVYELATANPIAPDEWLAALATVGIGWLGGVWGQTILANRESVYRTSRAIKGADRAGMVKAIGEQLASSSIVMIALAKKDGELYSDSVWTSSSNLQIPTSISTRSTELEPATVLIGDQMHGQIPGIHSLLLLTLSQVDEILVVASRRKNGFPRTEIQNYLTIAEQVSLSLENLQLVGQARQAGITQERQRLAAEIHDGLTQGFISIVTHLEVAEAKLENHPPELRTDLQSLLDQAKQTARNNLTEARQMTWALRPDLQGGVPVAIALAKLTNRWSNENGIPVAFSSSGEAYQLHPDVETVLLRAARESLTNIQKHSQASQVAVTLTYLDALVALDVQDNGQGFNPDALTLEEVDGGFGLKSLQAHAERLGGKLSIETAPGKGCTVAVSIPHNTGE